MPAMAPVPKSPFDGVGCEVLLLLGWLVAVLDGDVVDSPLVVVATEVVVAAWPSWVTYIRSTLSAIYRLVGHNWQINGTTYRTGQD